MIYLINVILLSDTFKNIDLLYEDFYIQFLKKMLLILLFKMISF